MRNLVTAIVVALACLVGLWLVLVDARTDDTGIEAGIIFLTAAALSAIRPRAAILVAILVGAPIPIAEALRSGGMPAGIVALGVSVAGALVGAWVGILMRRGTSASRA